MADLFYRPAHAQVEEVAAGLASDGAAMAPTAVAVTMASAWSMTLLSLAMRQRLTAVMTLRRKRQPRSRSRHHQGGQAAGTSGRLAPW